MLLDKQPSPQLRQLLDAFLRAERRGQTPQATYWAARVHAYLRAGRDLPEERCPACQALLAWRRADVN